MKPAPDPAYPDPAYNDDQSREILSDLIAAAKRSGADAADAILVRGTSISHAQRLGAIEKLERSEGYDLGLRVLIGKRQAIVASNDPSADALAALVERAVSMARAVPEDEFCGLADPDQIAHDWPELDMVDPNEPAPEVLIERARIAEDAARSVKGVTNSEGAEAGWGSSRVMMAASNGFIGGYAGSGQSISVSVLAEANGVMERDYDWTSAVYAEDLEDPALIGRRAGERAVKRLGARKMATTRVPVIFDPRVSAGIVGHMIGAISGPSIARGTSFLKDKLGQQIFPAAITIIDDPHRRRGARSKPFDGEGLPNQRRALIDKGVLTTWIMDLRSSRQLGLQSTGHASRGTSGPPGPSSTNLYMEPGEISAADLIGEVQNGFYVTELMGQGVNGITGDYSRGAGGFWIENGELAYPVNEVTIAGNLKEMFLNIRAADDLEFRGGTNAPTLRIDGMTLAGS